MRKVAPKALVFLSFLIIALFGSSCSLKPPTGTGGGGGGSGTGGGGGGGAASGGPFTIGGAVVGLTGSGLVLQDNGGDDLPIAASGTFLFKTAITSGGTYKVTIKTQPSNPAQNCSVTNATGTALANVNNVQVTCGNTFPLGGTVSGLLGTGLQLQDATGTTTIDKLTISGTGSVSFTFPTPLAAGVNYTVTIVTQPANPGQTCAIFNGTGTLNGPVNNVQIICPQPAFTIGGSVVGLVPGTGNTVELQNNAGDDLFVTGNTSFTFPTQITNGSIYNVSVFLQPTSQPQPCNLFNYTGLATANVSNVLVDCQHNDWNWISWYINGTNKADNYATAVNPIPVPDLNTPGGRDFAMTWADSSGNKWIFGGFGFPVLSPYGAQGAGFLNDIWFFNGIWNPADAGLPANGTWPQLERINVLGNYPAAVGGNGTPGSRWGGVTWTDATNNLWLFGGQGYASSGLDPELLNDIWEFVPGTATWTWRGGSNLANPSTSATLPGGRWGAANFNDGTNVWVFGGQGVDSAGTIGLLNDLWKYNIAAGTWTVVGGSNLANKNGVYGTKGTAAAGNVPGGRQNAVLWVDSTGTAWLFGGFGLDSVGTSIAPGVGGTLNDLWKFAGGQWTWVSGGGATGLANQNGAYGTQTAAAAGNFPGSRWGAVGWTDPNNNLFFFGGFGYGSVVTQPVGFLNDIWEYQASSGQWIWWKGSSNVNQSGAYLTNGIPFVNNVVGGRRGVAIWQPDANRYIWFFGGEGFDASTGNPPGYLNDLWTYLAFP